MAKLTVEGRTIRIEVEPSPFYICPADGRGPWVTVDVGHLEPDEYTVLALRSILAPISRFSGVQAPVVRERDFVHSGYFRNPVIRLRDIPSVAGARAVLRIWSFSDAPVAVIVAWFAAVDVTPYLAEGGTLTVSARTPRLWAMLTITDNATQQVTIVVPED